MQWGMDYLYGALHGTAIDPIRGRERYLAESIAELREIVNGHDDILAEAASRLARGTPARLPVSGMG